MTSLTLRTNHRHATVYEKTENKTSDPKTLKIHLPKGDLKPTRSQSLLGGAHKTASNINKISSQAGLLSNSTAEKESCKDGPLVEKAKEYCKLLREVKDPTKLIKKISGETKKRFSLVSFKNDIVPCFDQMLEVAQKTAAETDSSSKESIENTLVSLTLLQTMRKSPCLHKFGFGGKPKQESLDLKDRIEKVYLETIDQYIQGYSQKFLMLFSQLQKELNDYAALSSENPLKTATYIESSFSVDQSEKSLIQSLKKNIETFLSPKKSHQTETCPPISSFIRSC